MLGLTHENWSNLTRALDDYKHLGYRTDLACPWDALSSTIAVTLPETASPTVTLDGRSLVGSAEQRMLEWALDGEHLNVRMAVLTPCFRWQDNTPATGHHPYFAKVELGMFKRCDDFGTRLAIIREARRDAWSMLYDAKGAMRRVLGCTPDEVSPDEVSPVEEYLSHERAGGWLFEWHLSDLQINGVEVGSYGSRLWVPNSAHLPRHLAAELGGIVWAYGTGLAEPRATFAKNYKTGR